MLIILTKRKLDAIMRRARERAQEYFSGVAFPRVDVKFSIRSILSIGIDREHGVLVLRVGRVIPLSSMELEVLLTYYFLKLLSYQHVCPYDIGRASSIIREAIGTAGYALGFMVSNMLIEMLNDSYIVHMDADLARKAYEILKKLVRGKKERVVEIQLSVLNMIYGEKIFETSREAEEIAGRIYSSIFRRNINNPEVWPKLARIMAEILKQAIEDEEITKAARKISSILGYDPSKISLPMISIQTSRGGITSIEAFRVMYGVSERDITVSAPLLMGTVALKPKEILRLWYRERAREIVRVYIGEEVRFVRHDIEYPDIWCLGDEVEKLDINLSVNISPIMIPGYTTKKWNMAKSAPQRVIRIAPDVMIVIDSSGSMGKLHGYESPKVSRKMKELMRRLGISYVIGSKFDLALLAAFGILEYALNMGCDVAVVNFSDYPIFVGFSMNRLLLEDTLMIHQNGGTYFPVKTIGRMLEGRRNVLVIIISDAAIWNQRAASIFLEKLAKKHTVYFLHIELPAKYHVLEKLRGAGGYIINVPDPHRLPEIVLSLTKRHVGWVYELE